MNAIVKKLIIPLVALSFACGGAVDAQDGAQDDLAAAPLSFEPFTSYAAAQQHANRYGTSCAAVALNGAITADRAGYDWSWTFRCNGQVFAIVAVNAQAVRVTSHGLRTWMLGVSTFDPAKLAVNATDAVQILNKAGWRRPDSMSLTAPLTAQAPSAHWTATTSRTATAPTVSVFVDASSGDVSN